jgi:hypothetical protein
MKTLNLKMEFDGLDGGRLAYKWSPENPEIADSCFYRELFYTEQEAIDHQHQARQVLLHLVSQVNPDYE